MAHELAGALQQVSRIRQRCAVKEPHVYVRSEYIDVPEGRISQTCDRTAVMQKLPDFVPTFSHHLSTFCFRELWSRNGRFARHSPTIRAVCVDALVRICAGGDQQWSSLPRQLVGSPIKESNLRVARCPEVTLSKSS